MEKFDLDKILISIKGWGRFQKLYYLALSSVIIFSVFPMSYIFTARDIKYRCKIKTCLQETSEYIPKWLKYAVPYQEDVPSRCLYFKPKANNTCIDFNKSIPLTCNEFIYEKNQVTIVQDFNITCDENLWKLTTVGTISVLGELFCLPFAGFVSDRFGRKSMVIVSVFLSTTIGLLRSFSTTYYMYVFLEFLDSALGSGMYSGAFMLAIEVVDAKRRNLGNTIICCAFALGQVIFAAAAWISPSWRIMLRMIYLPGYIIVVFLWFVPESIRWLLSKNKLHETWDVLTTIAKTNDKKLEEQYFHMLQYLDKYEEEEEEEEKKESVPFLTIMKSKVLFLRTLHCAFTWICCNFPYYGLTIQSVALSSDIYINFMCTAIVEIPAYLFTYESIDKFGRRSSLAVTLLLSGIACILVQFVQNEYWLALAVFLSGKFFITMAYATLYIYTAEMFPTSSRHSTFAICSMFGRLGSMLAPQVPLLSRVSKSLPLIVFSVMTLSSGLLAFWFPETHNSKLPDEVSEAVCIKENTNQ